MITFDNVCFRYTDKGEDILRHITLDLRSGSYHFLTGASGSGKTSLMNLMYLATMPTQGTVKLFDTDIQNAARRDLFKIRQKIGVVFQDFRLLNHLSVFDNVALPMRLMARPEKEIKTHVSELLDWVGLGDHQNALPRTLSGGQQQRIAIARAVITRPKLVLADEPTGNLDDDIGFRLMGLFEQLNRMGTTMIIATHNTQIINEFGHPLLCLRDGTLESDDNTQKNIEWKIRNVF